MKILIFGASGKTGLLLTQQALDKGFLVTAFVRNPQKFPFQHPNLTLFKGDVAEYELVLNSTTGHDAVVCALGAKTPFKHDLTLIQGVRNIVNSMKATGVKRLIYLSFLGVRENRKELGFLVNQVVSRILKKAIEDHEVKENIISKSNLDWTIVRPPRLTNEKLRGHFRHSERILPGSTILNISRADLTLFMLQQISDSQYIKKKPRVIY
jgi:putative NADH-flavin reductase